MRGWAPFQSVGLGPLAIDRSISGAGSPFIVWGWVPLLFYEAGSPFKLWARSPFNLRGWVPFHYMGLGLLAIDRSISGAGSPFIVWG